MQKKLTQTPNIPTNAGWLINIHYNALHNKRKFHKDYPKNNINTVKTFLGHRLNKKISLSDILHKTKKIKPKIINLSMHKLEKNQIDLLKLI